MGYYQGDYYQGDYYQGDPFLGALLGKGIGWLAKKIFKRTLTTGAAAAGGQKLLGSGTGMARRYLPAAAAGVAASGMMIPLPGPFQMQPGAFLPGGKPLFSRVPSAVSPAGGCCPSGFHFNKQTSMAKATMGAPAGTICVRNRSMNVANPRALRRGLRRVAGFGKLAMRAKKDVRRAAKSLGA